MKKLYFILANTLFMALMTTNSYACYVCFSQVKDDPQNKALAKSILFLLGVIVFVLALLGKYFLSIRKREKLMMENN